MTRSAFGEGNVLALPPAALRPADDTAGAAVVADICTSAPHWAAVLRANESSKIYLTVCSGFVKEWISRRPQQQLPPPPTSVDEAYKLWFELQPPTHDVQRLLGVLMAAYEPLSSAQLDALGLLGARAGLPGWGLLFEDRDHLLQTLHLSLREFLLDPKRSGAFAADVATGHVVLAGSCLDILVERAQSKATIGPMLAYALAFGHGHLTATLDPDVMRGGAKKEATAVVFRWFTAFLERRRANPIDTSKSDGGTSANEPQAEGAPGGQALELGSKLSPSPWRARELVAAWLERQGEHGRSKLLAPELMALEGESSIFHGVSFFVLVHVCVNQLEWNNCL